MLHSTSGTMYQRHLQLHLQLHLHLRLQRSVVSQYGGGERSFSRLLLCNRASKSLASLVVSKSQRFRAAERTRPKPAVAMTTMFNSQSSILSRRHRNSAGNAGGWGSASASLGPESWPSRPGIPMSSCGIKSYELSLQPRGLRPIFTEYKLIFHASTNDKPASCGHTPIPWSLESWHLRMLLLISP
jgi:hypothetical protein